MAANVDAALAVSPEHPAAVRYATIGRTLTGEHDLPATLAIDAGLRWVADLLDRLQIPRLGQFGLTAEHVAEFVTLARKASSMRYNPVVLSDEALADILRSALRH
jgi:alcohol dehydrogenase class IV